MREAKEATSRAIERRSSRRFVEGNSSIRSRESAGDVSADVREAALMVGRAALSDVTDKTSAARRRRGFRRRTGRAGGTDVSRRGSHAWCRDCAVCARGAVVLR